MRWRAGSVPEISRNLEKSQPGERSNWSWQPGSWEKALRPIKPSEFFQDFRQPLPPFSATFLCHLSTVHQFCLKLTPLFVFTLILHPNHFKKEKFSPTFLRILEVCSVLFATLGTRDWRRDWSRNVSRDWKWERYWLRAGLLLDNFSPCPRRLCES